MEPEKDCDDIRIRVQKTVRTVVDHSRQCQQ